MNMNRITPSAGKVLISEPFLKDFYFRRSVVLLADHNEEGSFGLILNKPIETKLNDVLSEFRDFNPGLYLGGPVQTDSLFFIHRLGSMIEGSLPVHGNISWGGNIEQVRELIKAHQVSEEDIRFFVGYSGWSARQLDSELEQHAWVVTDKNMESLLAVDPGKMWEQALDKLGGDFQKWKNYPTDPAMN